MLKLEETSARQTRATVVLDKIATALDCPVSAFAEPRAGALAETDALLRLWLTIEDEQDRAEVLRFLRSLAPTVPAQQDR